MAIMFSAVFMPHVETALKAAGRTDLHIQWELPDGLYPVKGDLVTDERIGGYEFIIVDRILAFEKSRDMTFQILLDFAPPRVQAGNEPTVAPGANGASGTSKAGWQLPGVGPRSSPH